MSELTTTTKTRTDIVGRNPLALMASKLAENPTPENVDAICKLADKLVEMRKIDAKEDFDFAFTEMQSNMPDIVTNKVGGVKNPYADLKGIMDQIKPTLAKYGFGVRFEHPPATEPNRLASVCVLSHVGGHTERSAPLQTRAGKTNAAISEQQADAGGYYAGERYVLGAMLGIRAGADGADDARVLGMPLSDEQLEELKRRAHDVGANEKNLFDMAGVEKWEDIRTGSLNVLHNLMNAKARQKPTTKPTTPANSPPATPSEPSLQEQEAIRKAEMAR
jgi:hypothetical protein